MEDLNRLPSKELPSCIVVTRVSLLAEAGAAGRATDRWDRFRKGPRVKELIVWLDRAMDYSARKLEVLCIPSGTSSFERRCVG